MLKGQHPWHFRLAGNGHNKHRAHGIRLVRQGHPALILDCIVDNRRLLMTDGPTGQSLIHDSAYNLAARPGWYLPTRQNALGDTIAAVEQKEASILRARQF